MRFLRVTALLLALIMLFAVPVYGDDTVEKVIYVSPSGDDGNDGTIASPLATVKAAKEKAKELGGHLTVFFREGTYTFDSTLNFDSSDGEYVTYKAYEDEKVTFTAGVPFSGFEECTVNGVRALKKNVGDASFNMLYSEDTALPRTRYPESGYLYVKDAKTSYCENYDALDESGRTYSGAYLAMDVDKEQVPVFKNPGDAVVRILHFWKDEILSIKSYNPETGHMEFGKETSMTVRPNDKFFVENVFEALDKPGEWYLDKAEKILYYIPKEGETADNLTLWGAEIKTLVSICGVDGICFEKIIFRGNAFYIDTRRDFSQAAYDAPSCISCEDSDSFAVRNCEFRDLAACAVFLGSVVTNAVVDSCVFENIGAQAVYVRGENVPLDSERISKDIHITNNLVSSYGRIYFNAVGILIIHANSVEVSNNEIHDGYYTAISVGWVWGYDYTVTGNCKICNNLIYNIGQGWLSDMGGIYTLGNQPGTVLSGNVIHNVAADPEEGGYGGWGIYLDEGSSYILVEKNLVYACGSDAYHLHFGSYNTVKNNIFALSGESCVRIVSAPERVTPADGGNKTADFIKNIYLTENGVRAYSHMGNENSFEERYNIFWDITNGDDVLIGYYADPRHSTGILTAQRKGYIDSPVITDPGFRNPGAFDFALDENSGAVMAGFEPWDYSGAGTVKGTVIGRSTQGGQTAYNASSFSVPLTPGKESVHGLRVFFEKFILFFKNFFVKIFA